MAQGKENALGLVWFGAFPAPLRHASAFGLPPSQLPSVINEVPPLVFSLCRVLQQFWCSPELRGVDTGQVVPRARFGLPFLPPAFLGTGAPEASQLGGWGQQSPAAALQQLGEF